MSALLGTFPARTKRGVVFLVQHVSFVRADNTIHGWNAGLIAYFDVWLVFCWWFLGIALALGPPRTLVPLAPTRGLARPEQVCIHC